MKKFAKKIISIICTLSIIMTLSPMTGITANAATVKITGGCHVQNYGDRPIVSASAGNIITLGTTGKGLRLESFWLTVSGMSGGITYQSHVQNIGDQSARSNGNRSGTTGQSLRIEQIRIKLTGAIANHYQIQYRSHVENLGWQPWVADYQPSGTTGRSLRIECIEVRLVAKNTNNINNGGSSYSQKVNSFLNDSRFRNGASWAASKRPVLSGYSCSGCCAYAADFVKYVFGKSSPRSGSAFYSASAIRAGDIIQVTGSQHWLVVLERSGNTLKTAEGNWGGRVVVSNGTYTVKNGQLYRNGSKFRTFSVGYHYQ
ncbi:MAG: Ig domain-containing protein [Clostridia bacterium]|nr:Ig domain-containing protein [Clostridia bacterium]